MNYKFPKSEKLKLKRHIEQLFEMGKHQGFSPLNLKYLKFDESGKNLCGVSVPKRKIKKAVDRNRIKRQMREAYRLHKHTIDSETHYFHMMFVYSKSEKTSYQEIEKAMTVLLKRLKNKL